MRVIFEEYEGRTCIHVDVYQRVRIRRGFFLVHEKDGKVVNHSKDMYFELKLTELSSQCGTIFYCAYNHCLVLPPSLCIIDRCMFFLLLYKNNGSTSSKTYFPITWYYYPLAKYFLIFRACLTIWKRVRVRVLDSVNLLSEITWIIYSFKVMRSKFHCLIMRWHFNFPSSKLSHF